MSADQTAGIIFIMADNLFLSWKKRISSEKNTFLPYMGIAGIIFILTVAVFFVMAYVTSDPGETVQSISWNYAYTDDDSFIPENQLKIYNRQNPIITESGAVKKYLYLTNTFEPDEKDRTLVLLTDHSPMKVSLDGKEIYNNQFDQAEYVGNRYNAIVLPADTRETKVEVIMALPLSVQFDTHFSDTDNPAFEMNTGLYIGAFFFLVGILSLIAFIILSIIRKQYVRTMMTSLSLAYMGIAIFAYTILGCTYILNGRIWLNIFTLILHTSFILPLIHIINWQTSRKLIIIIVSVDTLLSAALMLLSFTPLIFKISLILMTLFTCVSAFSCAFMSLRTLQNRTQYSVPIFVISFSHFLISILSGILLCARRPEMYIYLICMAIVEVLSVFEYIYIMNYQYKKKIAEEYDKGEKYKKTVDDISIFIKNMLSCESKDDFFETAVKEIRTLLVNYDEKNKDCRICTGLRETDSYREIINENIEGCDYYIIEKNSDQSGRNCIFTGTYFEYIFRKGGIYGIIHVENINNGLDVFFVSMIEAAYCGVETSFENVFFEETNRSKTVVFEELAENSEIANGYSPSHLENIATYSYHLCKALNMDDETAKKVSLASRLHDIGKIAVPKDIINKRGKLSEDERILVAAHAEFGYRILCAYNDDLLICAAEIARYHHERYDGSGTNGLIGEEIPLNARIVTICDIYDALTTARPYKEAWSKKRSLGYLSDNSGKLVDPKLLDLFKEYIEQQD